MDDKDREAIRAHLLQQQAALQQKLPALKESAKPVSPDASLGRLTRMDAMQSQEIARNTLRQAEGQLALLEHALREIDSPDFGVCEECFNPIPAGRLIAMPGVLRCVACA